MESHDGLRTAQTPREILENEIVLGRLGPGTHLDEVGLANRFDVSRTPVREALIELAAAGLVEIRPRRGAFVTEIGVPRLIEMFEVMAELEGMCGRLAARRLTPDGEANLLRAHEACAAAAASADADDYYRENQHFHDAIYAACRNGFLADQARQLQNRLAVYRRLQLRVRNRIQNSLAEHQAVVDAILAGDGDRAEDLLRAHILIQGERFNDFIASLQSAA